VTVADFVASTASADGVPFVNPLLQTWTALNHGAGSYDAIAYRRVRAVDDGNATAQVRGYHCDAPSVPYVLDLYIKYELVDVASNGVSIGWRDGTTGELATIEIFNGSGDLPTFRVAKWTDHDTLSTTYIAGTVISSLPHWIRLVDDNTNRMIYTSDDGRHFGLKHSVARTDFLTPDQIFFGLFLTTASSFDTTASLLSFGVQ